MQMVLITALGVGGASVIGALIGFCFKKIRHRMSDIILSFAAGVMLAASVIGLILPSLEYGGKFQIIVTVLGIFCGALCVNLIDKIVPPLHKINALSHLLLYHTCYYLRICETKNLRWKGFQFVIIGILCKTLFTRKVLKIRKCCILYIYMLLLFH